MDKATKQSFPEDWLMNWIKQIHKGEDKNLVSNYSTIMVSSVMTKLNRTITTQRTSLWAEHRHKKALGPAGFRPKHFIVNHFITLREITK